MPTEDIKPPPEAQAPMPLAAFGALLRPQLTRTQTVQSRQPGSKPGIINTYTQGHPDEIYLKLLQVKHGIERHTADGWHKLIAKYKETPAHPSDPNYGTGA
jgi:hypothetical protein